MLVLYPLLAMNAPKQSMARKGTTSVVALGCKNLPVKTYKLAFSRLVLVSGDNAEATKQYCAGGVARDRPS